MKPVISERHVQAIWYDAAYRPSRLVTRRGTEVTVVSPGEWNLGPGPDFRRAVLEFGPERRRVTGDVEVHLCPADWDLHAHGADPAYRNVIAHVTWRGGPEPSSLPSGAVSIWLGRLTVTDPAFHPDAIDLDVYPFDRLPLAMRPCEAAFALRPDEARQLLLAAGRHRLKLKAERIAGRLAEAGPDARQVYYEEVMTAFGYSRNTLPFRRVARRLPLDAVLAEPALAENAFLAAGAFEDWDRRTLRPGNEPERRLAAAAGVMTATPALDYAEARDFSSGACRRILRGLCSGRFIGPGRAAAVLANVIVPHAIAIGATAEAPEWLPPEDISAPVRLMAFRLLGRDHNPAAFYANNGVMIQGLLHLYRAYCSRIHPDCEHCLIR